MWAVSLERCGVLCDDSASRQKPENLLIAFSGKRIGNNGSTFLLVAKEVLNLNGSDD
jgi:hypothetical protein